MFAGKGVCGNIETYHFIECVSQKGEGHCPFCMKVMFPFIHIKYFMYVYLVTCIKDY